jgi:hypothetical protein
MGLGDFLSGVKDAAVNVGKGAAFIADPRNLDDIAEGVGKAAEFVVENPGKTWDTAFEVGRAVVKDQLDPMNLAINAGLIGLTVATGGAAAPAFLAKAGLAAKSAEAGLTAGKAVSAGTTAVKAAKAADTAMDVAKGVKTTAKAVETMGDIGKGVETAGDIAQATKTGAEVGRTVSRTQEFATGVKQIGTGIRESKGLAKVENVMNAPREFMGAGREAAGLSRYGKLNELRAGQAEKIMARAGEGGAGGLRKAAARTVAGKTNPLSPAGAQTTFSRVTSLAGRGKAASETPGSVAKGVEVAADPQAAVEAAAAAQVNRIAGSGTGYTDLGMTSESLYGTQPALAAGQGEESGASSQVGTPFKAAAPPAGGGGPPSTMATAQPAAEAGGEEGGKLLKQPKPFKGGWKPQQHFWEGPGREAFGGISAGHNWRQIQPLRKIEAPSIQESRRFSTHRAKVRAYEAQQAGLGAKAGGDLNEQGAPVNFAPEMSKSGMYMSDQGGQSEQQQVSSLPDIYQPRAYNATVREPGEQPFGAIGPVKKSDDVLDVESYSPQDYGFDNSGQGYFTFPEMGTAAVGRQPNTGPMYQQGSRTSRRAIGPGTLGV